jgi:hypothetical protein
MSLRKRQQSPPTVLRVKDDECFVKLNPTQLLLINSQGRIIKGTPSGRPSAPGNYLLGRVIWLGSALKTPSKSKIVRARTSSDASSPLPSASNQSKLTQFFQPKTPATEPPPPLPKAVPEPPPVPKKRGRKPRVSMYASLVAAAQPPPPLPRTSKQTVAIPEPEPTHALLDTACAMMGAEDALEPDKIRQMMRTVNDFRFLPRVNRESRI